MYMYLLSSHYARAHESQRSKEAYNCHDVFSWVRGIVENLAETRIAVIPGLVISKRYRNLASGQAA